VQLSRLEHTYDRIILFIAIFGKEQKGNKRKRKKKKDEDSRVDPLRPLQQASTQMCEYATVIYINFFFSQLQHTKLKEEKRTK
jgi:hypothetical protein